MPFLLDTPHGTMRYAFIRSTPDGVLLTNTSGRCCAGHYLTHGKAAELSKCGKLRAVFGREEGAPDSEAESGAGSLRHTLTMRALRELFEEVRSLLHGEEDFAALVLAYEQAADRLGEAVSHDPRITALRKATPQEAPA